MDFVQNFPAISILICLFAGIISSGLKGRTAIRHRRGICICNGKVSGPLGK